MRKLFILGIALVAYANMNAGTSESKTTFECKNLQGNFNGENDGNGKIVPSPEQEFINPETGLRTANLTKVENIIAEENKIIESTIINVGNLFYIEKSTEEIIADDNKIIEGGTTTEMHPLYIELSIEERILEDRAIIEGGDTTEIHPLYVEPGIEERILEDRAIIESENTNEVQPLDIENINKKNQFKTAKNTLFVG